jgi:zinc protease
MNLLNIPYKKYSLPNGLEVIISEFNNVPLVAFNIWYKVGSANDFKGKTGLAHLFEHMMFQGSKHVPKEMHFKYIQEAGGTLNASTSFDRTNYYEKLPSNEIELALWLESDRMGFFLDALDQVKLNNQKSVVLNERLERYDNQPYGLAWEKLLSNIYPDNHPYSWPTIGFYKDIESYTLEDVTTFFRKFYSPSNSTIVIVGNVDAEKTFSLVEKYFGEITRNESGVELINNHFPLLNENRKLVYEDNVNLERMYLAWSSTTAFNEDESALDVLADILTSSKNSRLTRKLVYELEIAQDVNAMHTTGKYGGHFIIAVTAKPGKSLDDIKKIIFDEINSIQANNIKEQELQKSKNVIKSNFIYSLQNTANIADAMNLYNFYLDEPNSFSFDLNRFSSLTEENIIEAVKKYLLKNYFELKIIPKRNHEN